MSDRREILCKDKTIQHQYNNVYKALLRYQVHETMLIAQTVILKLKRTTEVSSDAHRSSFFASSIQEGLQDELAKAIRGISGTDLSTQICSTLADALCGNMQIEDGRIHKSGTERKLTVETQRSMSVADALIIVKIYGDLTIRENDGGCASFLEDIGVKVMFLDRRKLQRFNNSTNLKEAISQAPVPAFMPSLFSPNPIITGMRTDKVCELSNNYIKEIKEIEKEWAVSTLSNTDVH